MIDLDVPTRVNESNLGEVPMTDSERGQIVFRKYESTNKMVTDTIHMADWHIQVTADDRLGLTEDDGVIIDFIGKPLGLVAMTNRGEILTEEEAELREEATGQNLHRYKQFGFRIHKLTKTDGPAGRRQLQLSQDQKRADSESNLVDSISSAFSEAMGNLNARGDLNPDTADIIDEVKRASPTKGRKAKAG
jgi:hypothetical protein|tara:strand:- start:3027 stop:3599 length:573 start_codon:yes stop_codon:yes gene_type:complete